MILDRRDLPDEVRAPYLKEYREVLRQRLLYAVTEAERAHLNRLLDKADDSKPTYTPDSPPPVGAIDLSTLAPQIFVNR